MNKEACTPEMLREEAEAMFDGRLELLRAFIAERYESQGGKWRGFVLHFEEDLVTLDKMIAGNCDLPRVQVRGPRPPAVAARLPQRAGVAGG